MARWWWTVDRWTLGALLALIAIGTVLSMAASPALAVRIGYDQLHFVKRHLLAVPIAIAIMFAVSLLPPRKIRRGAFVLFAGALLMLIGTLLIGMEIKGARRWINVGGLGIQPSELVKPTFAVVAAWLFAEQRRRPGFQGNLISAALFIVIIFVLVKQPDFGMALVVATVWFAQFFMAGLRFYWLGIGVVGGASMLVRGLQVAAHVTDRINRFDPNAGDSPGAAFARSLRQRRDVGQGAGQARSRTVLCPTHMPISSSLSRARSLGLSPAC